MKRLELISDTDDKKKIESLCFPPSATTHTTMRLILIFNRDDSSDRDDPCFYFFVFIFSPPQRRLIHTFDRDVSSRDRDDQFFFFSLSFSVFLETTHTHIRQRRLISRQRRQILLFLNFILFFVFFTQRRLFLIFCLILTHSHVVSPNRK